MNYLCKVQNSTVQTVLLTVGATQEGYLKEGILLYAKRLQRYTEFSHAVVSSADRLTSALKPGDYLVLLDEHGALLPSAGFAQQMVKAHESALGKFEDALPLWINEALRQEEATRTQQ